MIHLPGVLAAAGEVERFCQRQGWRFCFIGGVALQRWGEPRLTQDVDLTRQYGKLILAQIRAELKPLLELKGDLESLDKLERRLVAVERRLSAKR